MKRLVKTVIARMGYDISRRAAPLDDLDAFVQQQRLLAEVSAPIIIDVGAHIGEISRKYAKLFPHATIHALEPFPNSFETLIQNTADVPQVIAHPLGLAEAPQEFEINANACSLTNSLLETDPHAADTWGPGLLDTRQRVSCRFSTLDNFAAEVGLERINLLKLDVQGAEQRIFDGARRCFAEGLIDVIYMEIIIMPTYNGQHRIGEYMGFLEANNMMLYGMYNFSHASGRLRQIDAIFVRHLDHATR